MEKSDKNTEKVKEADLSDLFGILKGKLKKTAQQLKDESRKGWE